MHVLDVASDQRIGIVRGHHANRAGVFVEQGGYPRSRPESAQRAGDCRENRVWVEPCGRQLHGDLSERLVTVSRAWQSRVHENIGYVAETQQHATWDPGARDMWHRLRLDPNLGAVRARDAGDDMPLGPSASDRRQHRMQVLGVRPTCGVGSKPAGAHSGGADQLTL